MRARYYSVRAFELAITFASCYLAVGSFFHSFIYVLIKQFLGDLLLSLNVSYTLAVVNPETILPQLFSVLVFIVTFYYWLFGSRAKILFIFKFNMALFLPEALSFSQLDWLRLFGVPSFFITERGFSELLVTGLVIVAGYIILYMNSGFLETGASLLKRGALQEESDLVFVNQSMILFLMMIVSFIVVFGAYFAVPVIKAQVHTLLQSQVYRYILLGLMSSIIIAASLLVYFREQIRG